MSSAKNIGIVGNGRIAKECAAILAACPGCNLTRIVIDGSRGNISPDLKKYCETRGLDHIVSESINNGEVIEYLRTGNVDLLFSINNHQIIRGGLLDVVPEGIINFHNGPLPRYGGLNACSWAIFNGETRHGVTWHYVTAGVDEGDIVAQKLFDVDSEVTALQLVMTCINEGIDLFKKLIVDVLAGTVTRTPQDKAARLYYFAREVPGNGTIDFSRDYESIQRLARALNFNPLESPLGHAAAAINGRKFFVDKVRLARRVQQGTNGEVMRADSALEIQANGTILDILEVRDEQKRRVPVRILIENYAIKPGMHVGKEML
jgi:methionyl-tRNA formyltransferase